MAQPSALLKTGDYSRYLSIWPLGCQELFLLATCLNVGVKGFTSLTALGEDVCGEHRSRHRPICIGWPLVVPPPLTNLQPQDLTTSNEAAVMIACRPKMTDQTTNDDESSFPR